MVRAVATICNKKGLHARAAAKVVKIAAAYPAPIRLTRLLRENEAGGEAPTAGGTSILSLLMLGADRGSEVAIEVEGPEAEAALHALLDLIARKFDEEE